MSQERTRFPITPQDRHRTARSFDDVRAVPEENIPRREERPQDKPLPPKEAARDHEARTEEAEDGDTQEGDPHAEDVNAAEDAQGEDTEDDEDDGDDDALRSP